MESKKQIEALIKQKQDKLAQIDKEKADVQRRFILNMRDELEALEGRPEKCFQSDSLSWIATYIERCQRHLDVLEQKKLSLGESLTELSFLHDDII